VTAIGRSDAFLSGSLQDVGGAIAGRAPGRTYVKDSQLAVVPSWAEATNGVHELHTFIKSLNLTDSFTTRVGFSVKAGLQAPTRPVSAGEVEAGSATNDFPAKSFFNVFVQVDLPGGGALPAIQLVNVDPLLVEQTNIVSFTPRIVRLHRGQRDGQRNQLRATQHQRGSGELADHWHKRPHDEPLQIRGSGSHEQPAAFLSLDGNTLIYSSGRLYAVRRPGQKQTGRFPRGNRPARSA
jgi:hypothetical protein